MNTSLRVGVAWVGLSALTSAPACAWTFRDVAPEAGLVYQPRFFPLDARAGVAAGDYDGDGWVDLYVVRGSTGPNLLFRNRGDGTFEEVGAAAGVAVPGATGAGPVFADYDGDGRLDLFVPRAFTVGHDFFRNRGDGTFEDVTETSKIVLASRSSFSAAWGDYDRDDDLDLAVTHWGALFGATPRELLWRNDGDGTFTDVSAVSGLVRRRSPTSPQEVDYSFTPNFADINSDGWPDLLIAGDFLTSQVFLNRGDGTFADVTDAAVITDENGMGSAVGDYDGDGDLDWFVSSTWDPDGVRPDEEGRATGISGNRLYRNRGDGSFEDATDQAGVRHGYWGWGSSFADLDNDGHLDLFHVNGMLGGSRLRDFYEDPARLFVSNGDGTFTERSAELGVDDRGQGRGVVAFDYDRDGDLDIFVANMTSAPRLFRNDGGNRLGHLAVALRGRAPNTEAIGARIHVTASGRTQLRELRAGSNYLSQDPAEAHFGLGTASAVDEVRVAWPDGTTTVLRGVAARQRLVIAQPPAACTGKTDNPCLPGGGSKATDCVLEWLFEPAGAAAGSARPPCLDGDRTCDFDGDGTNGQCTVRVRLCVNNHDPRLPACTPSDVQRIVVRKGSRSSRDGADPTNEQLLERNAAVMLAGNGRPERTADHCGHPVTLAIPAGRRARAVRVEAVTSRRARDLDVVRFRCRAGRETPAKRRIP